tara:strand:- start:4939 stop:7314 length:2376 start_codon:yes stop_codon:yes gene_type:complete
MAKLPQYERRAPLMADVPQLQTPQFREQINRSKSIQGSLDVITKFAQSQAEKQVLKQAAEYTVANPLTMDQLEAAKTSGINPIEQALNGGMVWNEAVNKLYAQQASTELNSQAYKHFDNTLARVEAGELADASQVEEALNGPLKAWQSVIAQIDPEEAQRFYAQTTNNGSAYYRKSLSELRSKEQERQDAIADDNFRGMVRTFRLDIQGLEPDALLAKYISDMENAETLFTNSSKKATYKAEIQKEFSGALYRHIAVEVTKEFGSSEEAIEAIRKGELGKYTNIWEFLGSTQRDALETDIMQEFSALDAKTSKQLTSIENTVTDLADKILDNQEITRYDDDLVELKTQAANLSGPAKESAETSIAKLEATRKIATDMQVMSISAMDAYVETIRGEEDSPEFILEQAETYRDKAEKAFNQDPVSYTLRKTKGVPGQIIYDAETQNIGLVGFKDQIDTMTNAPDYTPNSEILTKAQVNDLVSKLTSPDALTDASKATLATQIIDTFGQNAFGVFKQIAPKDPIFANVGYLLVDNPNGTLGTATTIIKGQKLIDQGIKLPETQLRTSQSRQSFIINGAGNKEDSNRILASANAYYIGSGGDTTTIDEDLMEQALWASSGGYIGADGEKYGGVANIGDKLVMIGDEFKTDEVPDIIEKSTLASFAAAVINNPDQTGSTIEGRSSATGETKSYNIEDLQDASLMRVDGNYMLVGDDNKPFHDINGNPIIINLQELKTRYETQKIYGVVDKPISTATGRGLDKARMRRQEEVGNRRRREIETGKKETLNTRKSKIGY